VYVCVYVCMYAYVHICVPVFIDHASRCNHVPSRCTPSLLLHRPAHTDKRTPLVYYYTLFHMFALHCTTPKPSELHSPTLTCHVHTHIHTHAHTHTRTHTHTSSGTGYGLSRSPRKMISSSGTLRLHAHLSSARRASSNILFTCEQKQEKGEVSNLLLTCKQGSHQEGLRSASL